MMPQVRFHPGGGAAFALALAASALGSTTPVRADRRIEVQPYRADRVISVHGQSNVQTMIEFAADERIENIAVGDSAAWQVTPNKRGNLLFLKPLAARAFTNMTVITDQRRYLFDLLNLGPHDRPLYVLRFAYPKSPDPMATPSSAPDAQAAAGPVPPAAPAPAVAPPPPARNTAWRMTGDRRLFPAAVWDDGTATSMEWKPGADLPAILAPGADGREGPVNFTVEGDRIIIEGVAPRYVLRMGKATAQVVRMAAPGSSALGSPAVPAMPTGAKPAVIASEQVL